MATKTIHEIATSRSALIDDELEVQAAGGGTSARVTAGSVAALATVQDAAANGSTKGIAAFAAADFNAASGVISLDYAGGQKASGSVPGFLSSTDWTAFNGKGAGTVATVSVATANGVSGSVANATTTPAITLTLGAITPTTVNGNTITTGTGTLTLGAGKTLTVTGDATIAGNPLSNPMNAGGQIIYGGSAGAPTALANGTVGQVLTSGGTTVAPTWTTPSGIGTVTHTAGALTASQVVVGNGTADLKALGSLGTTTTVLHGNAAGDPTWGAVNLATDAIGAIPAVTNAQTGTSYTVQATDNGKLITFSNSSPVAVTLPQATGSFGAGWYTTFKNKGVGLVTITPTISTFGGAATIDLSTGQSCGGASDGTNYDSYPGMGTGGGSGTVTTVSVTTANGVSGSVANATTTPAITLTLGAITPSTVNGNTITTGTGVLTLAAGKTLTVSNTITLTGTDSVSANVSNGKLAVVAMCIGDGVNAISANATSFPVSVPFAGAITGYTIFCDDGTGAAATCTIKTWKKATGTAMPASGDSISTSGVAISTGTRVTSSTVSDFTSTTVAGAGDGFVAIATAVSGAKRITFELEITKT